MTVRSHTRMAYEPSAAGRGVAHLVFWVTAGMAVALGGSRFLTRMSAELTDHSPVGAGGNDAVAATKDISSLSGQYGITLGVVATLLVVLGLVRGVTWLRRGGQGIRTAMSSVQGQEPPASAHRFASLPVEQRILRAAVAVVVVVAAVVLVVTMFLAPFFGDLWARFAAGGSELGMGTKLMMISIVGAAAAGIVVAFIADMLPRPLVYLQWWAQALTQTGPFLG